MSDNGLYDGALGAYDDYSEYMMTSGLGGVGQVNGGNDDNANNNINLFRAETPRPLGPGLNPTGGGARTFKKARMEEEKDEAAFTEDPEAPQDSKESESVHPGGGNADRRDNDIAGGEEEHGAGVDNEEEQEEEEEGDEDPEVAEFREHTQEELGRVCSTLQACLQDLAAEFMGYYRASLQVKQVYEQVLAKERAESRRLDALEPQVKLLKELVRSTAGMGGIGGGGIGGAGGAGIGGSLPASAATGRSTPGAMAMVPMPSHARQPQTPHRRAQQSTRHPSHSK